MSNMVWTEEQKKVIEARGQNILVSAAAGSGKTAVLVERIIQKVISQENPVDIDRMLIVTFTKAAAAEMRERIEKALDSKLREGMDNVHLQKQMTLVHNAQITTIHSFCNYVIRNYFNTINIDPAIRLGDEVELTLLKGDVVDELLEEKYAEEEESFYQFIEAYSTGKTDDGIGDFILQLYDFSISHPWPKDWLLEQKESFSISTVEDMEKSEWLQFLLHVIHNSLTELPDKCCQAMEIAKEPGGPGAYLEALESDLEIARQLTEKYSFVEYYDIITNVEWKKLKRVSKKDEVDPDKQELVKRIRSEVKETIEGIAKKYFFQSMEQMLVDLQATKNHMCTLIDLTILFADKFREKKLEKKVMDFNDLEHLALNILVSKDEKGQVVFSPAALELSEFYDEIMIDEYQDSNLVQEWILKSISKERFQQPNMFMVGDVKQSIYKFRLAKPELFMEKLRAYKLEEAENGPGLRIDLDKNFRSRDIVLDFVNFIFQQMMQKKMGEVEYDRAAELKPGADYPETGENYASQVEILFLVPEEKEAAGEEGEEQAEETERELEARIVAKKIKTMMQMQKVYDKELGSYREMKFSDIVILLRTISGWSEEFTNILMAEGIPAVSDTQIGYFSALEVKTVLNMLSIIDNPKQDIPLAAVLHSPMYQFSSEELAIIRAFYLKGDLYEAVYSYGAEGEILELKEKVNVFLNQLNKFRYMVPYTSIHSLIQSVIEDTGYGSFVAVMPAGQRRTGNLDMLIRKAIDFEATSYKGLFQFNRYIEKLHKYNIDFGEAGGDEAATDAVRIMSIHKSKGLEFPVVFVSGLGKQFNLQDARSKLLLHEELGLGPDFIDPVIRIKRTTLRKKAIQTKIQLESLGEELRVLYVALTRAKESLILTGFVKKGIELIEKWEENKEREKRELDFLTLSSAHCFLDWIGAAVYYPNAAKLNIQYVSLKNMVFDEVKKQITEELQKEELLNWDCTNSYDVLIGNEIARRMEYEYQYRREQEIPVKFTVSELKRLLGNIKEEEIQEGEALFPEEKGQQAAPVPNFISKTENTTSMRKGILYHKVMQEIDFNKIDTEDDIVKEIDRLVEEGLILEEEKKEVSVKKVMNFFDSDLAILMKEAKKKGKLYREKQFVIGLPAKELPGGFDSGELVLIQGIIDAYIQTEKGLVLIDYKTDYVPRNGVSSFLNRYRPQLDYYQRALEHITGEKVEKKCIYSFFMGKEFWI
ncbi:helicase-exonuclease AddAB subunit AddA [Anaeromicropila populeti]|uniref:ATP-dependent helicase/nuclease subunit A n=1 Tax=Anaeromicropila populeti TaxID=37658 RepID=A0A1I6HQ09_9FIRM|nr:helicase-exonuclease AddAB subunit AddA [Anaeromicropila populeti]SFR56468.1 DNA helicase/exodeoxyribonuclease V, subunit A [Anaeromicropila populeti]